MFLGASNILAALVSGGGHLGEAASMTDATLEAVVAGGDFFPLLLPR